MQGNHSGFSSDDKLFLLISCCFVTLLVISNIIAAKIIMVGNIVAPAAVLGYSLTFLATDTMSEVWGKERTRFVVNVGFFVSVLAALLVRGAIAMPAAPFWEGQAEFMTVLGGNLRITVASLAAYLISQHHDVWAFQFWKRKTGGRHLWLRNNLSTGVSQLLDTALFITLAFAGTATPLLPMILGQYILKVAIALLDTPLVYLAVHLIRKKNTPAATGANMTTR
ncbi:queuosine precursor transporter [Dethiobacter alkaliphilus]|uniref:queuosine precursor transporter n=1 Tax=Dethiobacter alkaliphilus TaxID=427926 RepID=UPI002226B958|nr:queuosine precursor transporter [Dethiobacter alkaliphilus]MCW3490816.1 queuosine precursor transporter [Dethiobacter alkaliphilus]